MNTLTSSPDNFSGDLLESLKQHAAPRSIILKFLKTPLRGVHATKDVQYLQRHVRTGDSACMLCGGLLLCEGHYNGSMVEEAKLEAHVRSAIHETRYFQLSQAQAFKQVKSDRLDRTELLRERAKRLILPKWRWHVNDLIVQYIDTPIPPSKEVERQNFDIVVDQLASYEQMECLAVLELAIVKSMKQSSSNNNNNDVVPDGTRGKETATIIPLVLPFLGKPLLSS